MDPEPSTLNLMTKSQDEIVAFISQSFLLFVVVLIDGGLFSYVERWYLQSCIINSQNGTFIHMLWYHIILAEVPMTWLP